MKIVCGSCQAKYSIADEKVAGKVFKIRCKRCSEVIVVRGDLDQEAAPESGNGSYDAGGYGNGSNGADDSSVDAIWHVVVNGEQAGPYTPSQLSSMLSASQLDWEAYVWCEGFENWLPMRDVPDLVAAISGQAEEQPAPVIKRAAAASAQPSMGADPFADEGGGAVGMFAQAAAPVVSSRANLFGDAGHASKAAAFDTNPKVVASAPNPRVSADQAMTGARNENSVLFSLKNLQALATGTSTPAMAPSGASHRPGFASGEGSGLIDIRALATATGVGDSGREDNDKDALLSLGSAQAGAFGALGSPMLGPGKSDDDGSKKGLAIAIVGGFALLAAAAIAIALILKPSAAPQATAMTPVGLPPTAAAPGVAPGVAPSAPPTEAAKPAAAAEPLSEGEQRALDRARQANNPPATTATTGEAREDKRHPDHGKHGSTAAEKPASEPAASKPDPLVAKPAEKPKPHGGSSIDDLLDGAIGSGKGGGAAKHEAAAAANLPDKPTREDVLSAMGGVKDAVKACAKGAGGVAIANVTVAGKTGRVSNVEVSGITGDVGSCIAKSVRKASFPKFKADDFQVKFPFRL
jgi:predicted Zn finger-like uncharacterized protein